MMTELYCLQCLDWDWRTFYFTSLAVIAVLEAVVGLVVPAVGLVAVVDLGDLVVPAADLVGDLVVPAVDLVGGMEASVDLIRVMVTLAVDMEDMV